MRRAPGFAFVRGLAATALGVPTSAPAQKPAPVENISSFEPRTPADECKALHVPDGFEVQFVAAEPDIHKPLNLAFDDQGRRWVTDTVEYPFPACLADPVRRARHGMIDDPGTRCHLEGKRLRPRLKRDHL
jgi:hypothetical protein